MRDAFGHPQSAVVLGGTSEIALALVDRLQGDRCRSLVLAGRDPDALDRTAATLERPGVRAATVVFDAAIADAPEKVVGECFAAANEPVDLLIVAVGELGRQEVDERDADRIAQMMSVNFVWPASALTAAAELMRAQGHGRIVVLSSVAGYRIRRANFVYGSSKAGLDAFALGLGESLRSSGVSIHVVRPGFVHTKMTAGRDAAPFAVGPERVARDIARGLDHNRTVIWSPRILRTVFGILGLAPATLWRRLPG
jgi:decaprenylphospho-beta-D-erythro-pentofuranosid-2-ulose 2-reductase